MNEHHEDQICINETSNAFSSASGPNFHVNERVLCTDAQQTQRTAATGDELPPLYEAVIRKSGLKHVEPGSRKILPERKKRGHGREHHQQQHSSDGDGIKEWCHLVHFQGWNSRWDRWMTEADVFRDTLENRKRLGANTGKIVRAPPKVKEEEKRKKKKARDNSLKGGGEENKDDEDGGNAFQRNLQLISMACALPFTLQTVLIDDRDKITKRVYPLPSFDCDGDSYERLPWQGITMLHVLPATMNVINVMGQFVRVKKGEDMETLSREQTQQQLGNESKIPSPESKALGLGHNVDTEESQRAKSTNSSSKIDIKQSASSPEKSLKALKKKRKQFSWTVVALFDMTLPLFLLYGEEREQFGKLMGAHSTNAVPSVSDKDDDNTRHEGEQPKMRPSEVYGAEHLFRFIIKLPFILSRYSPKDETTASSYILASDDQSRKFASNMSELVVFLQKHYRSGVVVPTQYQCVDIRP
ncbi:hypothetical protein ACHAWF_010020 [Thalassiosira exigua]